MHEKSKCAILHHQSLICVRLDQSSRWLQGQNKFHSKKASTCGPMLQFLVLLLEFLLLDRISILDPFFTGKHFCRYNSRGGVLWGTHWICSKISTLSQLEKSASGNSDRNCIFRKPEAGGYHVSVSLACVWQLLDCFFFVLHKCSGSFGGATQFYSLVICAFSVFLTVLSCQCQ